MRGQDFQDRQESGSGKGQERGLCGCSGVGVGVEKDEART